MSLCCYYPEMEQKEQKAAILEGTIKPITIKASMAHNGRHYFVDSKNTIPVKQGVEFLKQYVAADFCVESSLATA